MEPTLTEPVKRVVAVLFANDRAAAQAAAELEAAFGAIDFAGAEWPFDSTDYYAAEMGTGLRRCLWSFAVLGAADCLVGDKRTCAAIETRLALQGRRTVNLDSGYIDLHKLVLASTKPGPVKLQLGGGFHADLVLRYQRGAWQAFDWTFPDFRDGRYHADLLEIRRRYKRQLRAPPAV